MIGENRTLGYAKYGAASVLTLFIRSVLCSWMVSAGVVGAMISTDVTGKVLAMDAIMVFFYMVFEHSIVNMFLFPAGLLLGAHFRDRLPVVERDPDGAGQPRRRPLVHWPDPVRHPRQDGAEACSPKSCLSFGSGQSCLSRS